MSRPNPAPRRCAVIALVLVLVLTWVPLARAGGGGSLSRQYPLGTQTLCCQAGSGHSTSGTTTTTTATTATASPSRGHGGISILLVVVIGVIAFAPAAFIFRAGLSPRGLGRGPRHDPNLEPDRASSKDRSGARTRAGPTRQEQIALQPIDVEPVPDDGAPPRGVSRGAVASPSTDLKDVAPNTVENGDVAFDLGVVLYEQGHLKSAEAAWRRAAESHHGRAATRLGMALERRGDVDGASEAYRDAERWGDAVGSQRAAALRRPDEARAESRPAEEPVARPVLSPDQPGSPER